VSWTARHCDSSSRQQSYSSLFSDGISIVDFWAEISCHIARLFRQNNPLFLWCRNVLMPPLVMHIKKNSILSYPADSRLISLVRILRLKSDLVATSRFIPFWLVIICWQQTWLPARARGFSFRRLWRPLSSLSKVYRGAICPSVRRMWGEVDEVPPRSAELNNA
jgi:hypothetical protein